MISSWNLVNSWIAFVLPSISTPFMIMMFRQAARSFPHDIIEAARLEGLSEIQIFFPDVCACYEINIWSCNDGYFYERME